ncbi:MAG: hypothetical protein M3Y57_10585 [Acidobacteriota bacterium]|nr:hypothetical protein [Acidobacteriota bacterium]
MILYKHRFITAAECWYSAPVERCPADVLHCLQLALPLGHSRTSDFKTIWIDLRKPEEQLLREMNKTTRNEIRRAAQEEFHCESWHEDVHNRVEEFCRFFEEHAVTAKAIAETRRWTKAHASHGSLDLSRAISEDGNVLVWHAYYRDAEHARLKYSVSVSRDTDGAMRAVIGRANRFLHWQDIQRFKADSLTIYDLGGWYAGSDDEKLLRVNKFKDGFGGELLTAFHCTRALTTKGRLYIWVVDVRNRLARFTSERRALAGHPKRDRNETQQAVGRCCELAEKERQRRC